MGLKVIVSPDPAAPGMSGEGREDLITRRRQAAPTRGWHFGGLYSSIDGLIASVKAILDANPTECLETLEVNAHGNPGVCNGITQSSASAFGQGLRRLRLCDTVTIYLSGCNTGVRHQRHESIAQIASRHTPTEADDHVRVNVHGTIGFSIGTKMEDTIHTVRKTKYRGRKYAPYPDVTDTAGNVHPGSREASGDACLRGFREGSPL